MTDYINLAIPIITLATVLVAAWRAWRAEKLAKRVSERIQKLEITVDGRLQQLLDATRSDAHTRGVAVGRSQANKEA